MIKFNRKFLFLPLMILAILGTLYNNGFEAVDIDITERSLIPCGHSVGIKLYSEGVIVVNLADIISPDGKKTAPAKLSGVRKGDVIVAVNDTLVNSTQELTKQIQTDKEVKLSILRKKEEIEIKVVPKKSAETSSYKLGMWVKDSTAGIGTITFLDPKTQKFGALGHAISDSHTNQPIKVASGSIVRSKIVDIKKGEKGEPGELKGMLFENDIGEISTNTSCGIFGKLSYDLSHIKELKVSKTSEIKIGKAYILSNIEEEKVEKFEIEIEKVVYGSVNNKNMVIKITDERLIDKTGGIVQGMSGSPIIQNDKIIGAVTHVFINNPLKGYAVFIENMLNEDI